MVLNMEQKEYILCAAIDYNGLIITGYRHGNCYNVLQTLRPDIPDNELPGRDRCGFLTSLDRFVSRKEAYQIAKANNQLIFGAEASENGEYSILISESLYMSPNDF